MYSIWHASRMPLIIMLLIIINNTLPCFAVVHGNAELLKILSEQNKTNFEAIITWKGKGVEEYKANAGNYTHHEINNFIFAYDSSIKATRWNKQRVKYSNKSNGKSFPDIYDGYYSKMGKQNDIYEYGLPGGMDERKARSLVITNQRQRCDTTELDPRFFYYEPGGGPFYESLMLMYKEANNPKLLGEWYVTKNNNLVTLKARLNKYNGMIQYVFDLSAGGNIIEYCNKTSAGEDVRKYEYEEISGVWVLKSYAWNNISPRKDGKDLHSSKKVLWTNEIVNMPLKEDEFTIQKLGVKPGDIIHDNRIGMQYSFDPSDGDFRLPPEVTNISEMEETISPIDAAMNKKNQNNTKKKPSFDAKAEVTHQEDTEYIYLYGVIIFVAVIVIGGVGYVYFIKARNNKGGTTGA